MMYQDPEHDRYTFEHEAQVDCQSRLGVCKSICYKFPFSLFRRDVVEGVIRWKFWKAWKALSDLPQQCRLLRSSRQEDLSLHRTLAPPHPLWGFGCRNNQRWQVRKDYEKMTLNDELNRQISGDNENLNNAKLK
jgi:hypothetical protein